MQRKTISLVATALFACMLVATSKGEMGGFDTVAMGSVEFAFPPPLQADVHERATWEITVQADHMVNLDEQTLSVQLTGSADDAVDLELTDCADQTLQHFVTVRPPHLVELTIDPWIADACRNQASCSATACLTATLDGEDPVDVSAALDVHLATFQAEDKPPVEAVHIDRVISARLQR